MLRSLGLNLVAFFALMGSTFGQEEVARVLILGDSTYNQASRSVTQEFGKQAKITYKHPGASAAAMENFDELIGQETWTIIHFNFGLSDLHYRDPRTKTVRAMSKEAGGVRVSTPEEYEKNLERFVARLKATGAKLVYGNATPILESTSDGLFDAHSEIEYNAIAAKVMARHGIAVTDLHAAYLAQIDPEKPPKLFDYRGLDLHSPIVRAIQERLGSRP